MRDGRVALFLVTTLLVGCAGFSEDMQTIERERKWKTAVRESRELCNGEAQAGMERGFKLAASGKRDELKSAEGSLSFSRYTTLSQELEDYTAKADAEFRVAVKHCTSAEACKYIERTSGEKFAHCDRDINRYESSLDKVKELTESIEAIEVTAEKKS